MSRTVGYLLTCGGLLLTIGSYVLRTPYFIIVNGRFAEAWAVEAVIGLAITTLGVVIVRRSARRAEH